MVLPQSLEKQSQASRELIQKVGTASLTRCVLYVCLRHAVVVLGDGVAAALLLRRVHWLATLCRYYVCSCSEFWSALVDGIIGHLLFSPFADHLAMGPCLPRRFPIPLLEHIRLPRKLSSIAPRAEEPRLFSSALHLRFASLLHFVFLCLIK